MNALALTVDDWQWVAMVALSVVVLVGARIR